MASGDIPLTSVEEALMDQVGFADSVKDGVSDSDENRIADLDQQSSSIEKESLACDDSDASRAVNDQVSTQEVPFQTQSDQTITPEGEEGGTSTVIPPVDHGVSAGDATVAGVGHAVADDAEDAVEEDVDDEEDEFNVIIGNEGSVVGDKQFKEPSKDPSAPEKAAKSTKGVNIDVEGSIGGVPVCQFDIDSIAEKPWAKPGADISDYFNYGFNESTWKTYCFKQQMLRCRNGQSSSGGFSTNKLVDRIKQYHKTGGGVSQLLVGGGKDGNSFADDAKKIRLKIIDTVFSKVEPSPTPSPSQTPPSTPNTISVIGTSEATSRRIPSPTPIVNLSRLAAAGCRRSDLSENVVNKVPSRSSSGPSSVFNAASASHAAASGVSTIPSIANLASLSSSSDGVNPVSSIITTSAIKAPLPPQFPSLPTFFPPGTTMPPFAVPFDVSSSAAAAAAVALTGAPPPPGLIPPGIGPLPPPPGGLNPGIPGGVPPFPMPLAMMSPNSRPPMGSAADHPRMPVAPWPHHPHHPHPPHPGMMLRPGLSPHARPSRPFFPGPRPEISRFHEDNYNNNNCEGGAHYGQPSRDRSPVSRGGGGGGHREPPVNYQQQQHQIRPQQQFHRELRSGRGSRHSFLRGNDVGAERVGAASRDPRLHRVSATSMSTVIHRRERIEREKEQERRNGRSGRASEEMELSSSSSRKDQRERGRGGAACDKEIKEEWRDDDRERKDDDRERRDDDRERRDDDRDRIREKERQRQKEKETEKEGERARRKAKEKDERKPSSSSSSSRSAERGEREERSSRSSKAEVKQEEHS